MANMPPETGDGRFNTVAVQRTNDNSILSKFSMISVGYYEDKFLKYVVSKPARRSSLINRGYYIRAKAIEHALKQFLSRESDSKIQILSLGAGYDTAYFRLKSQDLLPAGSKFVEIDFPDVMVKKSEMITASEPLYNLLSDMNVTDGAASGSIILQSTGYCLLAVDLGELECLERSLTSINLDWNCPTLLLSECSITYMEPDRSSALIKWAADRFKRGYFVTYEQVYPNDGFGMVMQNHFRSLNSQLRSVNSYPTVADQQRRYISLGWDECGVTDMNMFYTSLLDSCERRRVEALEVFDEFEEWHLKCGHYVLVLAAKHGGLCLSSGPEIRPNYSQDKQITWSIRKEMSGLRRFGHSTARLNSSYAITVGGFGETGGGTAHGRLCDVRITNLDTGHSVYGRLDENSQLLGRRMHHTVTRITENRFLVMFGREAPFLPCENSVVLEITTDVSNVWNGEGLGGPTILCHAVTDEGDIPEPRWRHTASLVTLDDEDMIVIFGGRNRQHMALDSCYVLSLNIDNWYKMERGPGIAGRHSHSAAVWGTTVVISGGLDSQSQPLHDVSLLDCTTWLWTTLHLPGLIPRYSHTSHVSGNKLLLLGGVCATAGLIPGVAVVDLETRAVTEYCLPSQDPASVMMLHNHTSLVDERRRTIVVFGGGGNCFSFGTHFNQHLTSIPADQFS